MKKGFALIALMGSILLLSGTPGYAFPVEVGQVIKFSAGIGNGAGGGEFSISDYKSGEKLFNTFCLEFNEHVDYYHPFTVTDISDYAFQGGLSGADAQHRDYLSQETKWLYWNYINLTLDDIFSDFEYSNAADVNAVQYAIWAFEGEIGRLSSSYRAANDDLYNRIIDLGSGYDFEINGIVKVMNIVDGGKNYAQSQLVAAPVPEPATMLLLGAGLIGLAGATRKKLRTKR